MSGSLRPPGVHEQPMPEPGDTWDDYLARLFEPVDTTQFAADFWRGVTWCKVCGSLVRDGWQATHYTQSHSFKGF